jgi:hypothetical protein
MMQGWDLVSQIGSIKTHWMASRKPRGGAVSARGRACYATEGICSDELMLVLAKPLIGRGCDLVSWIGSMETHRIVATNQGTCYVSVQGR